MSFSRFKITISIAGTLALAGCLGTGTPVEEEGTPAKTQNAVFDPEKIFIGRDMPWPDSSAPADSSPSPSLAAPSGPALEKAASNPWVNMNIACKDVAVGYLNMYCVKTDGKLFYCPIFDNPNRTWSEYPEILTTNYKSISAARYIYNDGSFGYTDRLIAVHDNGGVYQLSRDTYGWSYVAGSGNGIDADITSQGTMAYIGYQNRIYGWNGSQWTQLPGTAKRIAHARASRKMVVDMGNRVRVYDWASNSWFEPATNQASHTVSDVCGMESWGDKEWHIGSGYIYYLTQSYPYTWTKADSYHHSSVRMGCEAGDNFASPNLLVVNSSGQTFFKSGP